MAFTVYIGDLGITSKKTAAVLLVLTLAFAFCIIETAEAQTEYSINIAEVTWDHTNIRILLIPKDGEPWWDPEFINLTLQAVDMWNNAFATFASKYQDFAYASNIHLDATVSSNSTEDFDVYITWAEVLSGDIIEATLGRAQLTALSGVIQKCDVTLAAKESVGIPLTSVVRQAVAAHEVGHALGLYHTALSDDVMFERVSLDISVLPISTLDVYGVAQVFRWRSVSSQFNPSNQGSGLSSVSLPSGIEYEYLNAPPQDPLTRIISSFLRWIQTLEGLITVILILFVIVGIAMIASALYRFSRSAVSKRAPVDHKQKILV